jgi:hypothetical protein
MPLSRINSAAIANNSVIAADIAAGSVTGDKLGLTSINANNVVDASITNAKLSAPFTTGKAIAMSIVFS